MKIGDIYRLNYPFDENPSITKERPAMILVIGKSKKDFHALKITSAQRKGYKYDVAISDWQQAGLSKPSYVRCDKIQSFVEQDIVKNAGIDGYIGTMSLTDQKNISMAFELFSNKVKYISRTYDKEINATKFKVVSQNQLNSLLQSDISIEIKKQPDKILINYNKADEDAVMAAITPPTNNLKR